MALVQFTNSAWDFAVLHCPLPVLAVWSAPWCPHCQALHPRLEALASQYAYKAVIGTVDADHERELTKRYKVGGIPALFLFVNGNVAEHATGEQSSEELAAMLDRHLQPARPTSDLPA